jgi:hypothetical protein
LLLPLGIEKATALTALKGETIPPTAVKVLDEVSWMPSLKKCQKITSTNYRRDLSPKRETHERG